MQPMLSFDQKSRFSPRSRAALKPDIDSSSQTLWSRRLVRGRARILVLIVSTFASFAAISDNRQVALESLAPTLEHQVETERIVQLMQRYHYKPVAIDDELDDALRNEKLSPVFNIFKRFRTRMDERALVAQGLLKRKFDFSIDENYTFNREDAQWPESTKALDDLWRKRVKNDILNLRLAEQTNDELIETLQKRYVRMATRVSQYSANDVFQFFINAYTQSVEPHTSYFSPRSSENFSINMSLSLEGIGTALQTENEYTVIRRIIAGGPAALSEQVSVDDRIVGVGNGENENFTR